MRPIDADTFKEYIMEACEELKPFFNDNGKIAKLVSENFCKDIDEQPTISLEPDWTPCSEQMPKEHEWLGTKRFGTTISDEVYVTFESPKGERFCRHLSFQNGKLSAFDQSTIDAFFKGSRPVAWMSLPEPYKGVTE